MIHVAFAAQHIPAVAPSAQHVRRLAPNHLPPSCCGMFLSPPFPGVTPPQVFQAPGEVPHFTVSKVLSSSQAGKGGRELDHWNLGSWHETSQEDFSGCPWGK